MNNRLTIFKMTNFLFLKCLNKNGLSKCYNNLFNLGLIMKTIYLLNLHERIKISIKKY